MELHLASTGYQRYKEWQNSITNIIQVKIRYVHLVKVIILLQLFDAQELLFFFT